ncbi:MAG: hypothetical protein ABFD77_08855 [Thermotogota bacterium]
MPRRPEHLRTGALITAGVAGAAAYDLPPAKAALEVAGAVLLSGVGSSLPDVLEPANRIDHWSFAHSVTIGSGLLALLATEGHEIRYALRDQGNQLFAVLAESEDRPLLWLAYLVGGAAAYMLSGAVLGVMTGYLSHLLLDQVKSKSNIPLMCRGL